ncbi:AraC family transcriptional regulator [Enterococcus ureilyticus]|uniref:AraC family transcriptional regulator n=1 Tax=Enterococcus ureilyticus TaxID=1131292 RepID=A0A1E5HDM6_9ENTE|nr:AraC family transcriptional regulator [Enterococcus ureilyticus]MBM7689943.1 AraC-like DNA-binding protein [Enterococcus ureilyticus]OEG23041.1 AraC family transcriptional regulator [Enterococcus ureilyticus]
MSVYLERPEFEEKLLFRAFINDGMTIVYPHWHKEIELIYSIHGTVNIGVGDEIVHLSEGEIYFFASGEPHYFLASPNSERIVYQFDLSLFNEKQLKSVGDGSLIELFETGEKHSSKWSKSLVSDIKQLLQQLFEEYEKNNQGKKYALFSLLFQLITTFYRRLPQTQLEVKKGAKASTIKYKENLELLDRIFSYVENHYEESLTLEEVAKYSGFSSYYFTRFFKANTGMTFMRFLTEYRINQAKFILANEKVPMIEVAEKSGFASVKTFHHVFKEQVGVSPLKYQKMIIE